MNPYHVTEEERGEFLESLPQLLKDALDPTILALFKEAGSQLSATDDEERLTYWHEVADICLDERLTRRQMILDAL